ncbi:C39 family peptidase [Paenibacillus aurantius]|uniref:C39 family peptidase n=1 Tax=Paenibacillus aurantius TaxID=2918900 RepID=A0AA96LKB4_9BACL|nr:C39 family peptidase [Paenibacillus aurantius]WNQ13621.1 C39 family peptidase [Paenibacillus aurantius]
MNGIRKTVNYTISFLLLAGLVFSSGVMSVLLYAKMTGKDWVLSWKSDTAVAFAETLPVPSPSPAPAKPASALLEVPLIRQNPELPSGCEVTSLSMLLAYYGAKTDKLKLAAEMKRDTTELKRAPDGTILSWGNPNVGFVGEITGRAKGFGIYHTALIELMRKYIPDAVDLTGGSFEALEKQVASGSPVVVWTTIDYIVPEPDRWVVWDTSLGPIRTTFSEHAVVLVGYDEQNVYVNDPLSGKSSLPVNKAAFLETWEAMGKQALSYPSRATQ